MSLDQYYTKEDVARRCLKVFVSRIPGTDTLHFIEPSAGSGSFFALLPSGRRTGLDIDPKGKGILKRNFLSWKPRAKDTSRYAVIGNPPFGKRSKTAVTFFNRAASMADSIGFIVPRHFQKYSVHSKLAKDFRLIYDQNLPEDSFYTPDGKDFRIRCTFQVWTRIPTRHKNLRLLAPPPTTHPDFALYQYNNTPEALKVFNEDWDFAVPRQGYENYRRREKDRRKCETNKQWILFKAKTKEAYDRLWHFDFEELAKKNTTIPGFGKADVVMEYSRKYA